jgi:hypothetical protein
MLEEVPEIGEIGQSNFRTNLCAFPGVSRKIQTEFSGIFRRNGKTQKTSTKR